MVVRRTNAAPKVPPTGRQRYGVAVISAAVSKPVADYSLDHERVLKVTDAVAPLGLPPLHACNRERDACGLLSPATGSPAPGRRPFVTTGRRRVDDTDLLSVQQLQRCSGAVVQQPPPQCGGFSDSL